MKRMLALSLVLALGIFVLGTPRGADATEVVQVTSYNIYLGADLDPITDAPSTIAAAAAAGAAFETVSFKTRFSVRVNAIADLIAKEDPDVVGLQEVVSYFVQDPSDGGAPPAGASSATLVAEDFLTLLLDELAQRGDHFEVACQNFNADVEFPSLVPSFPSLLTDLRLLDSDVILVRENVPSNVTPGSCASASFLTQLSLDVPGCSLCCAGVGGGTLIPECIEFTRGYSTVEATIRGVTYQIGNTHLEVSSGGAAIQGAQATELAAAMGALPGGAQIVTGDFNSEPSWVGFGAPTFIAAGFNDLWPLSRHWTQDETTCNNGTLDAPQLSQNRIDYVFADFVPSDLIMSVRGWADQERSGPTAGMCDDYSGPCTDDGDCAGSCDLSFSTPGGLFPADHCAVNARVRR